MYNQAKFMTFFQRKLKITTVGCNKVNSLSLFLEEETGKDGIKIKEQLG